MLASIWSKNDKRHNITTTTYSTTYHNTIYILAQNYDVMTWERFTCCWPFVSVVLGSSAPNYALVICTCHKCIIWVSILALIYIENSNIGLIDMSCLHNAGHTYHLKWYFRNCFNIMHSTAFWFNDYSFPGTCPPPPIPYEFHICSSCHILFHIWDR